MRARLETHPNQKASSFSYPLRNQERRTSEREIEFNCVKTIIKAWLFQHHILLESGKQVAGMATPAQRLIQDQNINFLYNGTTPGGKNDVSKADKRGGGLRGRKALNDISNSRKPSALPSVKKENSINAISIGKDPSAVQGKSEKGFVGRKALSDLTNSTKPRPKQQAPSLGRKLNAAPSCMAEEGFLHNHMECVKAQTTTVDKDYFLKSVGLGNNTSARKALTLLSKLECNTKHSQMEELGEEDEVNECRKSVAPGCCSPACRSPRSPYMSWEGDNFPDPMMIETPKLK